MASKTTLEYFMERTEKDLDEIKSKLDEVWSFKWRVIGMATATSFIMSAVLHAVFMFLELKK